jgi:hypothetical protein
MQDGTLAGRPHTKMLVSLRVNHFVPTNLAGRLTHGSFGLVQEAASTPFRGPDGHFRPASHVESTDDMFIGGWVMPAPRHPSPFPDGTGSGDASVNVTPPPQFPSPQFRQTGYPFVRQSDPFVDDTSGSQHLSAAERSQAFKRRKRFMDPYLQFTCGPLLRYDNVDSHAVWHGAALIVSACFSLSLLIFRRALTPLLRAHGGSIFRSCRRWVDI